MHRSRDGTFYGEGLWEASVRNKWHPEMQIDLDEMAIRHDSSVVVQGGLTSETLSLVLLILAPIDLSWSH